MTKTESYISFIIEQLQKGNVERGKVLSIFGKKWQTSDRTFDRAWKKAQQLHKEAQILIQKEKSDLYKESEIELQNRLNLSKNILIENIYNEIKELEDIIKRGYLIKKVIIEGNTEIKKEIFGVFELEKMHRILDGKREQIKKMLGYDAPNKTELTGKDGKNIMPDKFRIIIKKQTK